MLVDIEYEAVCGHEAVRTITTLNKPFPSLERQHRKEQAMKTRFLAIFVIALCFRAVNTEAAVGSPLPNRLSIGSDRDMSEGAVSNANQSFGTLLKFTNITNGLADSRGVAIGLLNGFPSFAAYTAYTISNNYSAFLKYKPLMDPNKELKLVTYVGYQLPTGGSINSLESRPTVGIVSQITSNSFVAAFTPTNLCVIVLIPGLQRYTIEVPEISYSNSWPATLGRPLQTPPPSLNLIAFPPERTTNDVVVIDSLWGRHAFELRISITAQNKKSYFTQFGDAIGNVPPSLSLTKTHLRTSFSRGSRVSILSSPDLSNWIIATNFSDLGGMGQLELPYSNNSQPRFFYRVGIR